MNYHASHYRTGQEIRPGDRILWHGSPGKVVFVLGQPGIPEEWASPEEWLAKEGFMLDTEAAGFVFEPEVDEDLDFVGRKQ